MSFTPEKTNWSNEDAHPAVTAIEKSIAISSSLVDQTITQWKWRLLIAIVLVSSRDSRMFCVFNNTHKETDQVLVIASGQKRNIFKIFLQMNVKEAKKNIIQPYRCIVSNSFSHIAVSYAREHICSRIASSQKDQCTDRFVEPCVNQQSFPNSRQMKGSKWSMQCQILCGAIDSWSMPAM